MRAMRDADHESAATARLRGCGDGEGRGAARRDSDDGVAGKITKRSDALCPGRGVVLSNRIDAKCISAAARKHDRDTVVVEAKCAGELGRVGGRRKAGRTSADIDQTSTGTPDRGE